MTFKARATWPVAVATRPYVDPYAQRIALRQDMAPAKMPSLEWITTMPLSIDTKKFTPTLALYPLSAVPDSYTYDQRPFTANVLRVFLKVQGT